MAEKGKRSRDEGDEFMGKRPQMTLAEEDNETSLMGQGSTHRVLSNDIYEQVAVTGHDGSPRSP